MIINEIPIRLFGLIRKRKQTLLLVIREWINVFGWDCVYVWQIYKEKDA